MKINQSLSLLAGILIRSPLFSAVLGLCFLALACCAQAQSSPGVSLHMSNGAVRLRIKANPRSPCTIQVATSLSPTNNWQLLTNVTPLSSSEFEVVDPSTAANLRVYRTLLYQVPTNVVTTNMVWIPPGTFVMGSPTSEALRNTSNETPHSVTLTKGFFMGQYEVTQGEYQALMNANPSYFAPPRVSLDTNRPVEQVSWYGATNYCWILTLQEQWAGRLSTNWVYRLPTESEWEYACRAGTTTAFHCGNALRGGMENFSVYYEYDATAGETFILHPTVRYLGQTAPVGGYPPNAWGLYDMHGNVWEWCQDWYGNYPTGSETDPQGPTSGLSRVKRGGGWQSSGSACRSAIRQANTPSYSHPTVGFRIVLAQQP